MGWERLWGGGKWSRGGGAHTRGRGCVKSNQAFNTVYRVILNVKILTISLVPFRAQLSFQLSDRVRQVFLEVIGDRIMVRYIGEIEKNQCNDALKEAGLFTDEGIMYNRVTFDQITKSEQFKLTLIWEITF